MGKRKEAEEESSEDNKGLRLQVYLANCGLGSRRKCEEFIADGHVRINSTVISKMGEKVYPGDLVYYKGREVYPTRKQIYLAFNKPPQVICSNADPEGRITLLSFFKDFKSYRLFSIGRLDYMSTGLLLMTNDGNFGRMISHPSSQIEKEYMVETKDSVPEDILQELMKGVRINGELYKIKKYNYKTPYRISLVLTEGKNREIRNIFSHYRIKIKKLQRTRIGCIKLSGIVPGSYRHLGDKEVKWLLEKGENNDSSN